MAKKQKYYQRKDGLFETIKTINGKRVAFRGHSCREVDQKLLAYQKEKERGRLFQVVADEWEREHEPQIRESTRRVYRVVVSRIKEHFKGPIREIRPLDVKRYIVAFERQGHAGNSVQTELSVLKMIFSHAVLQGDIDVNPAAEVKKSRGLPKKERTALTEEQEAIVRANWDKAPFGLFAYFLLYTGLRRGEALALSYSDIDRENGTIRVEKKLNYTYGNRPHMDYFTKSENGVRMVPLLAPLADALPKNRVGLIFPGKDGGFMPEGELWRNWRGYCRAVGLNLVEETDSGEVIESFPITPHCLRHSFATICYEAGLDIRQAAEICGDTPKVLEQVYTHLRENRKETAAEKLAEHFSKAATV